MSKDYFPDGRYTLMDALSDTNSTEHLASKETLQQTLLQQKSTVVDTKLASINKDPDIKKSPVQKKKKSKRCNYERCKKKLGVDPFDCKCGGQYCGKHRLGFDHECSFDFKQENRDKLSKQLVKIKKRKLDEI